jgi:hypothetical protein
MSADAEDQHRRKETTMMNGKALANVAAAVVGQ